jgi:LuxR family maltose regulon positive regulatory protein
MAGVQKAGFIPDTINGTIALADIEIAQGRLHQAMRTYKQALQLASTENPEGNRPVPWGTADLYVGMSELYRERNDLNTALDYLLQSKELGERNGFAPTRSRWCIATAKIRQVQGDLDGALELLHEARQVYVSDFFPNVRPAAALITRVWIAQGRLDEAFGWARERKLSADDDLSYLREYEHITLARAFLARARDRAKSERGDHSLGEAKDLLARLLHAAQESRRTGSSIEILVLQALTHQAQGDTRVALAPLEQALTLAEPEGYIRIFVDEGSPMAQLLQEIARQKPGLAPGYVRRLLSVLSEGKAGEATLAKQALIEPLSERELQVLRLLGSDLSGPEIARQLAVSLNTLNTHTKNIYTKLEVNNRRAAIHRAGELHLL